MAKMHVHFLGIGGSGASAAAAIAQAQGFEVSGCDLEPNNEFTLHIRCVKLKGHSSKHLSVHPRGVHSNIDILAVTPAIFSLDPQNPELVSARKHRIPIMTWQQFLGKYLTKGKLVIAVAGTHGKTTTTAMIAKILEDAVLDPTVALGAIVPWWKANYRVGHGEYFVIEADEYNDNFLSLTPDISVITNIEMDHPEYFTDFNAYKNSFGKFVSQTKQIIVANVSDLAVAQILKVIMKTPNGQISSDRGKNVQCLDYSKNDLKLSLKIPGKFNEQNASAAFQVGLVLGISPEVIKKSLSTYLGIGRRFEFLGKFKGADVYTDFGHHPTEIKTTMEAAREKFPKRRIWLIFEPHMFTRTKVFFNDFVKVFQEIPVDKIIVTDIYQSREVDKGLVTSQQLSDAIKKEDAIYIAKEELRDKLENELVAKDVIFFMGAGDIDKIAKELFS